MYIKTRVLTTARDAWKQQSNLSRTEAKRRYITTLIDTMHQYASPSPDSRELVAELEFVWDQVKSNVPSSSSSSPLQTLDQVGTGMSASYSALERQRITKGEDEYPNHDDGDDQPLQIKSPMSQSGEDLEAEEPSKSEGSQGTNSSMRQIHSTLSISTDREPWITTSPKRMHNRPLNDRRHNIQCNHEG